MRLASGPVIPSFGHADPCITHHHWFCTSWVRKHWGDILGPAFWQHIELTLTAVGIGFGIAFAMALLGFRFRFLDGPLGAFGDILYALPSITLFVILNGDFGTQVGRARESSEGVHDHGGQHHKCVDLQVICDGPS